LSKKAAKKAAKKTPVKSTPARPVKGGAADAGGPSVKFGPAKKELAGLKEKLQGIIDAEGDNLTIRDIIEKIDKLERVLICQVDMTRSF
jgi:hypothetical protein